MKSVVNCYILLSIFTIFAGIGYGQNALVEDNKALLARFESGLNDYVKDRNRVEKGLPKLPTKATPEQIEAHQTALLKKMQVERAGVKRGSIFTPEASILIKKVVANEFKDPKMLKVKASAIDAAAGVPLVVNAEYPETKEVVEMPPSLLLALPQLPKELRFRFAGRALLLMDRSNRMIIDYLPNALP